MVLRKVFATSFALVVLNTGVSVAQGQGAEKSGGVSSAASHNARESVASQLKELNAAHANSAAFLNANSKSMVGKIAVYQNAVLTTSTECGDLAAYPGYDENSYVYPSGDAALDTLYVDCQDAVLAEQEALIAIGADDLTPDAYDAFREMLGL